MNKVNCHNLKISPEYFYAVLDGSKKFEIRFEDRDYNEGDFVVLHEFDDGYTGKAVQKRIGFITNFEQKECYIVFSLIDI